MSAISGSHDSCLHAASASLAMGSFQDGQTAKARSGYRVQSLPLGHGHALRFFLEPPVFPGRRRGTTSNS